MPILFCFLHFLRVFPSPFMHFSYAFDTWLQASDNAHVWIYMSWSAVATRRQDGKIRLVHAYAFFDFIDDIFSFSFLYTATGNDKPVCTIIITVTVAFCSTAITTVLAAAAAAVVALAAAIIAAALPTTAAAAALTTTTTIINSLFTSLMFWLYAISTI
ncbi:hypothetical protein BDF19DRAFT_208922 [Syncephalis fuscata]|nr:hypothetical protein BDF19DRAFT_208922 [Syncephalis fuscata]